MMYGHVGLEKYKNSLKVCLNAFGRIQGGVTRRGGTYYVRSLAENNPATPAARLMPFQFSVTQAYVLEFNNNLIRFYKNHGVILNAGVPYSIATPYASADLPQLKIVQSADVVYIVHPNYAPRKLSRLSDTNWTLTTISFIDGPYLSANTDTTSTITPSGTVTGTTVTLTASQAIFAATDVGRAVRLLNGSTWGWGVITVFTSTTVVSVLIKSDFGAAASTSVWRLGIWSATTGYPAAITFFQDRLCFGGATNKPQRIDGSNSGDYENFAPTSTSGVVSDSNAISFTLNSNDQNVIRWMLDDEKGLLVGTAGGEWIVRASSFSTALTPTNINATRSTGYGSADIQAVRAGKATLYVQRSARKLRELAYVFQSDGFNSPDITLLSEHVTYGGVFAQAYQQERESIVWMPRNDGVLVGLTYSREQDVLGWHRHVMGGFGDATSTYAPKVESICVIPHPSLDRDELWLIVLRYVNGAWLRSVEYMTKPWELGDRQDEAFHVDCGLSLFNNIAANLTVGAGAQTQHTVNVPFTADAAVFGAGDVGRYIHYDYKGADGSNQKAVAKITQFNSTTQVLASINVVFPTLAGAIPTNTWRMTITVLTGLGYLEGQTVTVYPDGAAHPTRVVTGGSITLQVPASKVTIGLGYNTDIQTLRPEAGSQDGTSQGKTKRTHRMVMRLYDTLGLKIGRSFNNLNTITFRTTSEPLDTAPPLFNGDINETWEGDYDLDAYVCARFDGAFPGTILAIAPQLQEYDR